MSFLDPIEAYYTEKLAEHGCSPAGVDWNGLEGQVTRFRQLLRILDNRTDLTILDLGCGYGALADYLLAIAYGGDYVGIDISSEMIREASSRFQGNSQFRFLTSSEAAIESDICVASGLFNVRLHNSDSEWWDYMIATLDQMDVASRVGFAFNCLTTYSDREKQRNYLFYVDPLKLFDLCKSRYGRNVALLHDYDLFEFTMLVRK